MYNIHIQMQDKALHMSDMSELNSPSPDTHNEHPEEMEVGPEGYSIDNPPPAEVIKKKLYAVHVTRILPEGDTLIAGATRGAERTEDIEDSPSFRPTIHFALGGMAAPFPFNDFEGTKYAVIAPLGRLETQLVNVSPHDTFVLGDLTLTPDMRLIVPEGTDVSQVTLGHFMHDDSTRMSAVFDIINHPGVISTLRRQGYELSDEPLCSPEDLYRAHPDIKILFERERLLAELYSEEDFTLLKGLGAITYTMDQRNVFESFEIAKSAALEFRYCMERYAKDRQSLDVPMNQVKDFNDFSPGEILPLQAYLQMKDSYKRTNIAQQWAKFGLGQEFREAFPAIDNFWRSPYSLREIYHLLLERRSNKQKRP